MNYPSPNQNPACVCKGNPMRAFWCSFGHMLECHFPHTCTKAACSHLAKYDFDQEQIEALEADARAAVENGALAPYRFDEHGQIVVDKNMRIIPEEF